VGPARRSGGVQDWGDFDRLGGAGRRYWLQPDQRHALIDTMLLHWRTARTLSDLSMFLQAYEMGPESVKDIYARFGHDVIEIPGPRHRDGAAHGSGCTHSSVLAARLAWGDSPLQAARTAKEIAAAAVSNGLIEIGAGAGPVNVLGPGLAVHPF